MDQFTNPTSSGSDPVGDRAAVNRNNARKSTGPRTEAGKQVSRFNALRHGLTGQVVVLPSEDQSAYQRHNQAFLAEYQPKGATEAQLVQFLTDTSWRLNRIASIETNLFTLGISENDHWVNADHPQAQSALAMALAFRRNERTLANLSIYSQRLQRQFERALAQLRQIQAERRSNEKSQLDQASKILKMHNDRQPPAQPIPYNPAADGFVFSLDEIETHTRREDRAGQAYVHYLHSPA